MCPFSYSLDVVFWFSVFTGLQSCHMYYFGSLLFSSNDVSWTSFHVSIIKATVFFLLANPWCTCAVKPLPLQWAFGLLADSGSGIAG